jgi:hypothetical protein
VVAGKVPIKDLEESSKELGVKCKSLLILVFLVEEQMNTIKLDSECLKHINLFQAVTKAGVKDCIIDLTEYYSSLRRVRLPGYGRVGLIIRNLERLIRRRLRLLSLMMI